MNLREDKHWAYGAGGFVMGAKEERVFLLYAPVQTDKTAESVTELRKEIAEFTSIRPATKKEVEKVKTNQVLSLPGQWETNSAVNRSMVNIVKYGLADDYYQNYDEEVRNLSVDDIIQVSQKVVNPEKMNWFMVGDRAKTVLKLEELGFDEIIEIDADGNPVKTPIEDVEPDVKN